MRQCGPCTACCTVMAVEEIAKPAESPCPMCTGGGCSIYEDRPASCRGYRCAWHRGILPVYMRPDEYGLIVDPWEDVPDGGSPGLIIREVRPGAFDAAFDFFGPIVASTPVIVTSATDPKRRLLGPTLRVTTIRAVMAARAAASDT